MENLLSPSKQQSSEQSIEEQWDHYNEQQLIALIFEIASVGVSNRQILPAIQIFNTLLEATPELELPLVGAGFLHILLGEHKKCIELLESRERLLETRTALYDATLAHAMYLSGRVGEAERLLENVIRRSKESDPGVAFAQSILDKIRQQYQSGDPISSLLGG